MGWLFGEQPLELGFVHYFFPFLIIEEIGPVTVGFVARRMLEQIDELAPFLERSLGWYPIAQRFQSMLLENPVGMLAEALDQVLEPALACMIDT